jgi:hypothetical protein
MDVIREITDFIIGKWEGDYRWGDLCQVEWRRCVLEKVKDFYFWSFLCCSLLGGWEKTCITPVFNDL